MQLQVLCLTKPFSLLLFSTFSFLLLNRAGKLAWGDHVLDFGHVPSGLGAVAFRSHAEWAIKHMTKKEENSPPQHKYPMIDDSFFIYSCPECLQVDSKSQMLALIQIPRKTFHISHNRVNSLKYMFFSLMHKAIASCPISQH